RYFLVALLAALTLWVGVKFLDEARDLTKPDIGSPTINVSGEGKVFAKPDIGSVSFSVISEGGPGPEVAQQDAAQKMESIVLFLKNSGVDEKDIKTVSYDISPLYSTENKKRELTGYEVRQTLALKVRDLAKLGALITGATELGANSIGGVSFEIDDSEALKLEARAKAIADAKAKARVLSKNLGVRLGEIISFSEYGGPVPFYGYASGFGMGGDIEKSYIPPIPTGQNEIVSNVNITFEIR
ncbi:MAG: SIMPL domain-containing protein, partial [Candidatus Niyogibacteria bacterium]|nr:SIMPL domain-containing protein [Candidatus Niyogibacteria bacterium]